MAAKKKKRPTDINLLAASIVKDATEPKEPEKPIKEPEPEKNPAAVALGRLGGLKGGKARAKKLSAEKRKDIARKAAEARWSKKK
jgi:hypothetical protein